VENNYEKADKLLEIRDNAHSRLILVDAEIDQEKKVSGVVRSTGQP
jgi:beta-catenin-like protein 1